MVEFYFSDILCQIQFYTVMNLKHNKIIYNL